MTLLTKNAKPIEATFDNSKWPVWYTRIHGEPEWMIQISFAPKQSDHYKICHLKLSIRKKIKTRMVKPQRLLPP
jgi:hypothetical protein